MTKKSRNKDKAAEKTAALKRHGPVPYEVRVRIVQAVMRGTKHADVAVGFGVSVAAVQKFVGLFQSGGAEALHPRLSGCAANAVARKQRRQSAEGSAARTEVVALRGAHPEWGTRRLRDVLARFAGLGVSETTVRRILHEEGLIAAREVPTPRDKPERRFERAEPNQLWQSDIFTFELRRHQRVYVAAFMDDHSRYLVSWAMAHHQKSSLVIEALERGIAEYGEPREVLTDQGRQYAAWRGTTEFQELLRRRGIAHAMSRPQHPQTLGKIERFWKTLWEEFLGKTVFADFTDCQRRLALYVQHYNFQRTHQGLGESLVPADRFFRAAPHVRAAIEAQVTANALLAAQEKPPQKPFYLVGRLGDQDVSIAAAGGALRVQLGDAAQTIPVTKEDDHVSQARRHFPTDEEASRTTRAPAAPGAALADGPRGSGSDRAATVPADLVGVVGGEAGDDGDRGARDLAAAVLPARDQGDRGDADGARAWGEHIGVGERRDAGAASVDAGGEDRGARAGQAALGTPAVSDAEGAAARAGVLAGEAGEARREQEPQLGERWARTLAILDDLTDEAFATTGFDPDDGWRDDAVSWRRKLAGARAPLEGNEEELGDGATPWAERTVDVSAAPESAGADRGSSHDDQSGARRAHDDQRGGGPAWDGAGQHADPRASSGGGDYRGSVAETVGAAADVGAGTRVGEGGEAPAERECEAAAPAPGSGRHDGRGGGDHPEPAGPAPDTLFTELLSAISAYLETEDGQRGSGTGTVDGSGDARARADLDEP